MQPTSLDDPLYYLRNAEQVVSWCLQTYADLLAPEELALLSAWQQLDHQPKALLIRLVMRKGVLFRVDKLNYQEIPELEKALAGLAKYELVQLDPSISALNLAEVLLRQELWQWLVTVRPELNLPKQCKKADLLQRIEDVDDHKSLTEWWPDSKIDVVKLTCNDLFERLRLLFFGNLYQDWSEFVLSELGLQRYEKVPLTSSQRAFQSLQEVDFYLLLHDLLNRLEEGESATQLAPDIPVDIDVVWLQEKLQKALFGIGHLAEREGNIDLALSLYRRSDINEAKVRCLRVMEKHATAESTWQQSVDYLSSVEQPAVRLLLQRVAKRCANKLQFNFVVDHPAAPVQQTLSLPFTANYTVEQAVINDYQLQGLAAFHVENGLFTGLFGLLFWPAIYAPVPGAFFHPFQARPKDLYSPQFGQQRQALIDESFASLENGDYLRVMVACWQQKQGINNRFVNWKLLTQELLDVALQCIPAEHLQVVFKHMLADLRNHCSGMPDLIVFDESNSTYDLVEVKGPGDRLQEHQKFWLDFYQRNNIPAQVIYVEWQT